MRVLSVLLFTAPFVIVRACNSSSQDSQDENCPPIYSYSSSSSSSPSQWTPLHMASALRPRPVQGSQPFLTPAFPTMNRYESSPPRQHSTASPSYGLPSNGGTPTKPMFAHLQPTPTSPPGTPKGYMSLSHNAPGTPPGHPMLRLQPQPGTPPGHPMMQLQPQPGTPPGHPMMRLQPQPGTPPGPMPLSRQTGSPVKKTLNFDSPLPHYNGHFPHPLLPRSSNGLIDFSASRMSNVRLQEKEEIKEKKMYGMFHKDTGERLDGGLGTPKHINIHKPVIPRHLQIHPEDSDEVRKAKRDALWELSKTPYKPMPSMPKNGDDSSERSNNVGTD